MKTRRCLFDDDDSSPDKCRKLLFNANSPARKITAAARNLFNASSPPQEKAAARKLLFNFDDDACPMDIDAAETPPKQQQQQASVGVRDTHFYETYMKTFPYPAWENRKDIEIPMRGDNASNATWFNVLDHNLAPVIHVKVEFGVDGDPIINDAFIVRLLNEELKKEKDDALPGHFLEYVAAFMGRKTARSGKYKHSSAVCAKFVPFQTSGTVDVACLATRVVAGGKSLKDLVRAGGDVHLDALSELVDALTWAGETLGFSHNDLHAGNILWDETHGKFVVIDYGRSHVVLTDDARRILGEECAKYAGTRHATFDHMRYITERHACAADLDGGRGMYILNDLLGLYANIVNLRPDLEQPLQGVFKTAIAWKRTLEKHGIDISALLKTEGDDKIVWVNQMIKKYEMQYACAQAYMEFNNDKKVDGGGTKEKREGVRLRKLRKERGSGRVYAMVGGKKWYLDAHRGKYRYSMDKAHVRVRAT